MIHQIVPAEVSASSDASKTLCVGIYFLVARAWGGLCRYLQSLISLVAALRVQP